MDFAQILRESRLAAGVTQADVAERTGIARSNVAAHEAGRREPRFSTATRLLGATGAEVRVEVPLTWRWTPTRRPYAIASRLWRLSPGAALRSLELPPHLWWSGAPVSFDLGMRADRIRAYEIVLREGTPADIVDVVDGLLLCEAWDDLVLPGAARLAWQSVVDRGMDVNRLMAS